MCGAVAVLMAFNTVSVGVPAALGDGHAHGAFPHMAGGPNSRGPNGNGLPGQQGTDPNAALQGSGPGQWNDQGRGYGPGQGIGQGPALGGGPPTPAPPIAHPPTPAPVAFQGARVQGGGNPGHAQGNQPQVAVNVNASGNGRGPNGAGPAHENSAASAHPNAFAPAHATYSAPAVRHVSNTVFETANTASEVTQSNTQSNATSNVSVSASSLVAGASAAVRTRNVTVPVDAESIMKTASAAVPRADTSSVRQASAAAAGEQHSGNQPIATAASAPAPSSPAPAAAAPASAPASSAATSQPTTAAASPAVIPPPAPAVGHSSVRPSSRHGGGSSTATRTRSGSLAITPTAGAGSLGAALGSTTARSRGTGSINPKLAPGTVAIGTRAANAIRHTHPHRRPVHLSGIFLPLSFLGNAGSDIIHVVPLGVWIALGAALALAAVAGVAALLSGRRARRKAGEIAAVTAAALTDPLTGVLNRRGFIEAAERELDRARRYEHPLALAFVDIRGLKAVNDTEGHLAGDRLLKQASLLLRESARTHDVVGRIGGDELAVLLAEQSAAGAGAMLQRVRAQVPAYRTNLGLATQWDVTIGTSSFPEDGDTFEQLLAAADRRLYQQRGIDLAR